MNSKHLEFISYLSDKKIHSIQKCAFELGVSTRSIQLYITALNHELSNILKIENKKSQGILLSVFDNDSFQNLLAGEFLGANNDPKFRKKQILYELVFLKKPCYLDDLAENINISRSTLVNDLKQIEEEISTFELSIHGTQNVGIHLVGNEINKRILIENLLYDMLPQSNENESKISSIINELTVKMDLTSKSKYILIRHINILINRLKENFNSNEIEKFEEILKSNEYEVAVNFVPLIESAFEVKCDVGDIIFIALPIYTRMSTIKESNVSEDMNIISSEIMNRIFKETNIFIDDAQLLKFLNVHLQFAMNRLKYNIIQKNPFSKEIHDEYPLATRMAYIASNVINENYNVKMTESEIDYLAMYFGSFLELKKIQLTPSYSIVLISANGRGFTQLFINRLKRVFDSNMNFEIMSLKDYEKNQNNLFYDLIISLGANITNPIIPIIHVNSPFDVENLQSEIQMTLDLIDYKVTKEELNKFYLNAIINKNDFFRFNAKTYEEALLLMCNSLSERGIVDEGFYDRLILKEQDTFAIFDTKVSMPHLHSELQIPIYVEICNLENSVFWKGKEVNFIFLIVLPKENINTELLIKIYDEILSMINRKWIMKDLKNAKEYNLFIKKLEQIYSILNQGGKV